MALNQALQNINSSYNIKAIFENFAADNLFLSTTYPGFYDSSWNDVTKRTYTAYQYAIDSKIGIDPFGIVYHEISGFEDDTEVSITFDLISGDYSDFTVMGVVHNGSEPMESLHISVPNPERFTLTLSDHAIEYILGNSDGYTYYTLVTVNTNYTSSMEYNITIN